VYFYITGFFSVFIAAARDSTFDSEDVLRVLRVRHLANAENYVSLPIPFLTGILPQPSSHQDNRPEPAVPTIEICSDSFSCSVASIQLSIPVLNSFVFIFFSRTAIY
jgi:hypothetical protein